MGHSYTGLKKDVSLSIFLLVNFAFALKYLSRYTAYALPIALGIAALQLLLWKKKEVLQKIPLNYSMITVLIFGVFSAVCCYLFIKVPVESLKIDRWSVTTSFWDSYFQGKYAYAAKSFDGNPPGPMPFYFIVALPFYLLGELGYLFIFGLMAFYFLLLHAKIPALNRAVAIVLLLTSLSYLHEVICRSNVILFSMLVIAAIAYFFKEDKAVDNKKLVICAVLTGLLMSTRNVYVIPFIIVYLYALRSKQITFTRLVFLGVISLVVFALTFVPFVAGHFEEFKVINPFVVQSTFLIPFEYTVAFVVLSAVLPFLCKSVNDVYFYSGLSLFLIIAVYLVYHIVLSGFETAFYDSRADITYFLLGLPFSLYHLVTASKEKAIVSPV